MVGSPHRLSSACLAAWSLSPVGILSGKPGLCGSDWTHLQVETTAGIYMQKFWGIHSRSLHEPQNGDASEAGTSVVQTECWPCLRPAPGWHTALRDPGPFLGSG